MYTIYALIDNDGVVKYVGQTTQVNVRKRYHKNQKPPHNFVVLKENLSEEDAKQFEINSIAEYNTYKNGWNMSPGGEGFDGYERTGIGGVKKGNIPWNKGKSGCFGEETISKMSSTRKGKIHSSKLTPEKVRFIRDLYNAKPILKGVGDIQPNGKVLPYERAFSRHYAKEFGVTPNNLHKIILYKSWTNV
jgi:hypothetical protein